MHASIHGVFVFANRVWALRAVIDGRNPSRWFVAVIAWSTLGSSPALAQGTYLGKWNSQVEVKPGDQIPQLSEAHNRTFRPSRPLRGQQHDELGSAPPSLSNRQQEQPRLFQNPDDVPLLIPETPSESSFTTPEIEVKGSELFGPASLSDGRPTSVSQTESPDYVQQRGFNDLGINDDKVNPAEIGSEMTYDQGNVQIANFEEPFPRSLPAQSQNASGSSINQSSLESARLWIDQYLVSSSPNTAGLRYRPVSLVEMLRQPVAVNQRFEMIAQYWETWSQWAELNSRTQFASWIGNISDSGSPPDVQLLQTSKSQTQNQVLEAKNFLVNAQSRLQSFMPQVAASSNAVPLSPLPSDNPLIHPYVTNYQLYRNYLSMPEKYQNIDRELDENLTMIVRQTQAVESARSKAESELTLYQGGRANLSTVIEAGQNWRLAEMNLIRAIAQYNQRIADYSLNVTDGKLLPETVAAILIGKSGNKRDLAGRHRHNFQIHSAPPRTQNTALNPIRNPDTSPDVIDNTKGIRTPISSSLSDAIRQPTTELRPGRETFPGEANSSMIRSLHDQGRSSSDRTAESPAAAQFGNLSSRPSPERNVQPANSSRIVEGNSTRAPANSVNGGSAGNAGDFNSPRRMSNANQTSPAAGLAASAKFDPLTPLSKPQGSGSNLQENKKTQGSTNPVDGGIEPFQSSKGSINPPKATVRANEGSSSVGGSFNPRGINPGASKSDRSPGSNSGTLRPNDFDPPTQSNAQDNNRKSSLDFRALPNETTKPSAGQILPPDSDKRAGQENDLDSILD